MCDLCGEVEKERRDAIDLLLSSADDLASLSHQLRQVAYSVIDPHSEKAKLIGLRARRIIRYLVDEWM